MHIERPAVRLIRPRIGQEVLETTGHDPGQPDLRSCRPIDAGEPLRRDAHDGDDRSVDADGFVDWTRGSEEALGKARTDDGDDGPGHVAIFFGAKRPARGEPHAHGVEIGG